MKKTAAEDWTFLHWRYLNRTLMGISQGCCSVVVDWVGALTTVSKVLFNPSDL